VTHVNSAGVKAAVAKISTGMTDLYISTETLRTPKQS